MMTKNDNLIGHLAMVATVIIFGFNLNSLKALMPEWVSAMDSALFRLLGATILFWFVSLFIKNQKIDRRDWIKIVPGGMIGLFLYFLFLNYGLEMSSAVDVSIIMTIPPIIVVLLSALIYKTPLTKRRVLGLFVSLSGALILILTEPDSISSRSSLGNLYTIAAAVFYALYLLIIKEPSQKYNPITLLRWIFLLATLSVLPFSAKSVLSSPIVVNPDSRALLLMGFIILFPTFFAYLFMPIAIKRIGQDMVSVYLYFIPAVATATAVYLKVDKLEWDQPLAVAVIIAGVIISSRAKG